MIGILRKQRIINGEDALKKILFLIHDLGQGGAEKVLVNLVNNLDQSKYDISVIVLFGGGVNEQFLSPHIHLHKVFPRMIPGNSLWMKLFTPKTLHKICIKENYDIEISYLEGPSARVVSGCNKENTKLVGWIHSNHFTKEHAIASFRSGKEAELCYGRFDRLVCVSQFMKANFCQWFPYDKKCCVLYNTVDSDLIIKQSKEEVKDIEITKDSINLIAVGTFKKVKGFERLLTIVRALYREGYPIKLYLLGDGPFRNRYKEYIKRNQLDDRIALIGYRLNPYKYISRSDLVVCSSYSEGFSTVVTESLILGVPVCTTNVSGMSELLGDNNEYGVITDNNTESLYDGIKNLIDNKDILNYYRIKAKERGAMFSTEKTVKEVEKMLDYLLS